MATTGMTAAIVHFRRLRAHLITSLGGEVGWGEAAQCAVASVVFLWSCVLGAILYWNYRPLHRYVARQRMAQDADRLTASQETMPADPLHLQPGPEAADRIDP